MAMILKTSTHLYFHDRFGEAQIPPALQPEKAPSPWTQRSVKGNIGAVTEMKRRNSCFGCRKIAEQISRAFAIEINKDVVRRILIRHYRPVPGGDGLSWLTVIGHAKDQLVERRLLSLRIDFAEKLLDHGRAIPPPGL